MSFLILVAALVVLVVLYGKVSSLRARVEHIERYLQKHTATLGASGAHATPTQEATVVGEGVTLPVMTPTEVLTRPAMATQPLAVSLEPDAFERFGRWFKEDWLMKLAGLLVILGMGWFVSYAIAQNWIGESGRIALGLLAGAAVLALGRYRLQAFLTQGSILMFTGATVMVLTLFAARELYDMFTPLIALVLMFGISALLGVTSVITRYQPLAIANVLLAAVAPLLVNMVAPTLAEMFLYLLILSLGAVGVAVVTGWRILPFLSLIVVGIYSSMFMVSYRFRADLDVGLLYAYGFTALFFMVSILAMRVARRVQIIDLLTAVGSGLFLMYWIFAGAKDEWQSLLFVVWTVVFAFGAFMATRLGAGIAYFYVYAGVGATYVGIATALELDGPSLTIAAICEATLVLWLGYRITDSARHLIGLALPMIIPILLSFESMSSSVWHVDRLCIALYGDLRCPSMSWFESVFHGDAFVLLFLAVVFLGFGYLFKESRARRTNGEEANMLTTAMQIAFVLAGVYASIIVWLVTHAGPIGEDTGTMFALLVYTLVAAYCYMAHRATGARWYHYTAIAYTIFVVGRLLLVEAWQMELLERVITFLLVGLALGAVAWIERSGKRSSAQHEHDQPNTEHHA